MLRSARSLRSVFPNIRWRRRGRRFPARGAGAGPSPAGGENHAEHPPADVEQDARQHAGPLDGSRPFHGGLLLCGELLGACLHHTLEPILARLVDVIREHALAGLAKAHARVEAVREVEARIRPEYETRDAALSAPVEPGVHERAADAPPPELRVEYRRWTAVPASTRSTPTEPTIRPPCRTTKNAPRGGARSGR